MDSPKKKHQLKPRIESFSWNSKQELCAYFQDHYCIENSEIEKRIESAMKSFKLRKGRPIDPKELWQKVGNAILNEQKYMKKE